MLSPHIAPATYLFTRYSSKDVVFTDSITEGSMPTRKKRFPAHKKKEKSRKKEDRDSLKIPTHPLRREVMTDFSSFKEQTSLYEANINSRIDFDDTDITVSIRSD
jgi:hypothetical protein